MTRTLAILTLLLLATGVALAAETAPETTGTDATTADTTAPAENDGTTDAAQSADAAKPENEATTDVTAESAATTASDAKSAKAEDGAAPDDGGPKRISGMSVLGNREAPKSLVIVPWKSSRIGDGVGISAMLDDGRGPVDREVFLRALSYWEIRSEGDR
jgi:hypothetical protein